MRSTTKRNSTKKKTRAGATVRRRRIVSAEAAIRRIGDQWAQHWNAEELDAVVAAYAADAVYLPPHHKAVHGRDAVREYLKGSLRHRTSDLAFEVTYVKQQGPIAWDVGTFHMTTALNQMESKDDHGKYLTVWKRIGGKWLIVADAWSSDLPAST